MGYQSTPKDRIRAITLGVYYVVLAVVLAYLLFKVWPPTPWPSDEFMQKNPAAAVALASYLAECNCVPSQPNPAPVTTASPAQSDQSTSPAATSRAVVVPEVTVSPTSSPGASPYSSPNASPSATGSPSPKSSPSARPAASPAAPPISIPSQALVENIPIKFFRWCISTSFDERLILLVIIAGMLGSFVHGATSIADYIGNDNFNKNWTWFYLLRPAIGMSLALVFYFVVRGGFLTTSGGAKDINPFGIAALAGLVGMFSKQATDKLSEVFSTLFKASEGQGDDKRKGSLKPSSYVPTIEGIEPAGPIAVGSKGQIFTINGTNFVDGSKVSVNGVPQESTFKSPTQLTATLADTLFAKASTLEVTVVNPGGEESEPANLVVS